MPLYYDPSTTKWISKDPLEEEGGWNLTSFCSNDPVNKMDSLGLWGFDMHFYAVYLALLSSGTSKDEAWLLAYWSATPDIDSRHDAFAKSGGAYMHGPQSQSGRVQQILHQLNGLKGQDIVKMREALRKLYKESKDPVVKGYVLHSLGDTYGHMKAKTKLGVPAIAGKMADSKLLTGDTKEEMYIGPLGHTKDYVYADWVSLRPDLAESYLRDLYSLVGGQGKDVNMLIRQMRTDLNSQQVSVEQACKNWRKYILSKEDYKPPVYAQEWDPVNKKRLVDRRTVASMTDEKFSADFVHPLLHSLADSHVVLPKNPTWL